MSICTIHVSGSIKERNHDSRIKISDSLIGDWDVYTLTLQNKIDLYGTSAGVPICMLHSDRVTLFTYIWTEILAGISVTSCYGILAGYYD